MKKNQDRRKIKRSKKKKIAITIDNDVFDYVVILTNNLSGFINECLKEKVKSIKNANGA